MYTKKEYRQFLPLIPIGMGTIQPEWIDIYENPVCPPPTSLPLCPDSITIKINFYPRCPR